MLSLYSIEFLANKYINNDEDDKELIARIAAVCGSTFQAVACTGISLTSRDGSYVQARTIEWARGVLQSEYVIIPRGQQLTSFTPTGVNGLTFTAKYGVVGLAVVQKEFIAEGINEAGLSAGLFFFPHYGDIKRMMLHRTSGHWQTFK